jgi:hypothetical protein
MRAGILIYEVGRTITLGLKPHIYEHDKALKEGHNSHAAFTF